MTAMFLALTLLAAPSAPGELDQLIAQIEHAVVVGSVPTLEASRRALLQHLPDGKQKSPQILMRRYTLAYVDWRINFLLPTKDARRDDLLEEAAQQLALVLESRPRDVEAMSLLSAVYGAQISRSFWKGMILGPRIGITMGKASELEPDNPRLALQKGISAYYTPAAFGGSIERAESELARAEILFAKNRRTEWPNWGELDVLIYRGKVCAKKGDVDCARTFYHRVLAIAPDLGWVRRVLLPALDRQANAVKE